MGTIYAFECPSCGYSAEVSGGGDSGFVAITQTFVCQDCLELFDAMVSKVQMGKGVITSADIVPVCPEDSEHRISKWNAPGPCPRCGTTMTKGTGSTMFWD